MKTTLFLFQQETKMHDWTRQTEKGETHLDGPVGHWVLFKAAGNLEEKAYAEK